MVIRNAPFVGANKLVNYWLLPPRVPRVHFRGLCTAVAHVRSRGARSIPSQVSLQVGRCPPKWYSTSSSIPVTSKPSNAYSPSSVGPEQTSTQDPKQPHYEMTFTCKPCNNRSTHVISKHSYHNGSVLITCPSCQAKHVITDHLRIFSDNNFSLEEFMKRKGSMVKRGRLEGDIEFWDDGTTSERSNENV